MKATIEFELPEESDEHKLALDGAKWMGVCHEFDEWLRGKIKHESDSSMETVRNIFHQIMTDAGVSFE